MDAPRIDNVVIFDGVCKLCARSVRFILNHEDHQLLRFAPLQSVAGARLMREFGFDPKDAKTFVLIAKGTTYTKSDAAIEVARYFRRPWRLLRALKVVPRPLRDWLYDLVARNRYGWFGRLDSCIVPTPETAARFLER